MTATPFETALSMEGVTVFTSEQEIAMPSTPRLVNASIALCPKIELIGFIAKSAFASDAGLR